MTSFLNSARRTSLGFHDIRVIDAADASLTHSRLQHFLHTNLPEVLPRARASFDEYKDLLSAYANKEIKYADFASRVMRRLRGESEMTSLNPDDYDLDF